MKLAVLVGCIPILQHLLKAEEQKPGLFTRIEDEWVLPSFLLAAASCQPGTVNAFLSSHGGKIHPKKRDFLRNTGLHHAMRGTDHVNVNPHLLDFVGCDHVFNWRRGSDLSSSVSNPHERKQLTRRVERDDTGELKDTKGVRNLCVLILLQGGVDVLAVNERLQTASPDPNAPHEFARWWYEKEVQEIQQMQKSLNDAANSISVTAALVATASFVGPLQPPLSYGGDPLGLQIEDISVRIFIVFDTLSFYLALAAIMLALLPSLPKPHQPAFILFLRTKRRVAGAVALLFPSIICVLVAFGAGSIGVIRGVGFSHQPLTIITVMIGGVICLRTMISFMDGLVDVLATLIPDTKSDWGKLFEDLLLLNCSCTMVLSIYTSALSIYNTCLERKEADRRLKRQEAD